MAFSVLGHLLDNGGLTAKVFDILAHMGLSVSQTQQRKNRRLLAAAATLRALRVCVCTCCHKWYSTDNVEDTFVCIYSPSKTLSGKLFLLALVLLLVIKLCFLRYSHTFSACA
jgi:hypothetical protein